MRGTASSVLIVAFWNLPQGPTKLSRCRQAWGPGISLNGLISLFPAAVCLLILLGSSPRPHSSPGNRPSPEETGILSWCKGSSPLCTLSSSAVHFLFCPASFSAVQPLPTYFWQRKKLPLRAEVFWKADLWGVPGWEPAQCSTCEHGVEGISSQRDLPGAHCALLYRMRAFTGCLHFTPGGNSECTPHLILITTLPAFLPVIPVPWTPPISPMGSGGETYRRVAR